MDCPQCTFRNSNNAFECEMCGYQFPRQRPSGRPQTGRSVPLSSFVSSLSQFSFGGESACAYGTLELASLLICGVLDTKENGQFDQETMEPIFEEGLKQSVTTYRDSGAGQGHSSPLEIIQTLSDRFPAIELVTTSAGGDKKSTEQGVEEIFAPLVQARKVVFPDVMLPLGDVQIERFEDGDMVTVLTRLQGSGYALSVVNIGYVFGVHCRTDRRFVVFDTHKRDVCGGRNGGGGFMALFDSPVSAARFAMGEVLSSRRSIIQSLAGGGDGFIGQQAVAANNVEIHVFRGRREKK